MDTLQVNAVVSIMENLDSDTLYKLKIKIDEILKRKENHKWIEHYLEKGGNKFEKELVNSNFTCTRDNALYVVKDEFKYCLAVFHVPLLIRDVKNGIYWSFTGSSDEYQINGRLDSIEQKDVFDPDVNVINFGIFLWKHL